MNDNNAYKQEALLNRSTTGKDYAKFILPSLFGIVLFLFPVIQKGSFNIPMGILTEYLIEMLADWLPLIITCTMVISGAFTLITYTIKPSFIMKSAFLSSIFKTSTLWTMIRTAGAIFALMTYFTGGFSLIYSDVTGQVMYGLLTSLIMWFFVASFLMPYLINFGAMEFFGTLSRGATKPLFTLPGRSAIDLLASWIGNVNVGVVITREQYQEGYYTGREAAAIATCFSTVSLPFCLVIAGLLNLEDKFPIFYLTIVIAGIISAIIIPRIPPLSKIPDTYYTEQSYQEDVPPNISTFKWAVHQAVMSAQKAGSLLDQVQQGGRIFAGIALGLMPQVMAIGTLALIVAEYTPLFQWISQPLVPVLQLLQIPEADAAAPATVIGFIDMFLPTVLASGIESELTRFVVGALSLVQIIYITEMGTLLMLSKIPIKFGHLFLIFAERTVISLPIITIIAHFIY
ncbi:MAG: YjiH family protein [Bacillus sp. (in: firmicutes)]